MEEAGSTSKSTGEAILLTRVSGSSMTDTKLNGEKLMDVHEQVQGLIISDGGKYRCNEQAYLRTAEVGVSFPK